MYFIVLKNFVFFSTFCFSVFFSMEIICDIIPIKKQTNMKLIEFVQLKVHIMKYLWILAFDLYTKSRFLAVLGLTCTYKILLNFGTACPGVINLVPKVAQDLKEKMSWNVPAGYIRVTDLSQKEKKCRGPPTQSF